MEYFIDEKNVIGDFDYPFAFKRIVELNLVNFDVWIIMNRNDAIKKLYGLKSRYTNRNLIPFALRQDCDDVACFDLDNFNKVCIIHDYASPGYEQHRSYDSFWDWFRSMVESMIEYEEIEEEYN